METSCQDMAAYSTDSTLPWWRYQHQWFTSTLYHYFKQLLYFSNKNEARVSVFSSSYNKSYMIFVHYQWSDGITEFFAHPSYPSTFALALDFQVSVCNSVVILSNVKRSASNSGIIPSSAIQLTSRNILHFDNMIECETNQFSAQAFYNIPLGNLSRRPSPMLQYHWYKYGQLNGNNWYVWFLTISWISEIYLA